VAPIRIAVVGLGKIAHDQHLPAIAASADFTLVAGADPGPGVLPPGVPHYHDLPSLLADGPPFDALALCTPPQVRGMLARDALRRGIHVLLEKPPGGDVAEVEELRTLASEMGVTLFAAWHSRFAGAVEPARVWLEGRTLHKVSIVWREDVRVWHPGQRWIWQKRGLGVFDPGINSLSIATRILPRPLSLSEAQLEVPANREAPIAARLSLTDAAGVPVTADFDWRQTGEQTWDIEVETDGGTLVLSRGGAVLRVPEGEQRFEDREYPALYAHFAQLIRGRKSDVDLAPFKLVQDALLRGETVPTAAFED